MNPITVAPDAISISDRTTVALNGPSSGSPSADPVSLSRSAPVARMFAAHGTTADVVSLRDADSRDGSLKTPASVARAESVNGAPGASEAASETLRSDAPGRGWKHGPMRLLLAAAAVSVAAAVSPTAVSAATQSQMTSDQLARLCQARSPRCADYLSGAYDGAMESARSGGERQICPSSKPTTEQLIAYFMMMNIFDEGKNGDLAAVKKAITAFKYAMPCHCNQHDLISIRPGMASVALPAAVIYRAVGPST